MQVTWSDQGEGVATEEEQPARWGDPYTLVEKTKIESTRLATPSHVMTTSPPPPSLLDLCTSTHLLLLHYCRGRYPYPHLLYRPQSFPLGSHLLAWYRRNEYDDRTLFGGGRRTQINWSFMSLRRFDPKLRFSGSVEDNGIRVSEIVWSKFSFKSEGLLFTDGNDDDGDEGNQTFVVEIKKEMRGFPFFIKEMDLGNRDPATSFFLVCFLIAAYGWVILGFLVTYSRVFGIVFVSHVDDHLWRTTSFIGTVWDGPRLGLKRLSRFSLMRWAVRDGMT